MSASGSLALATSAPRGLVDQRLTLLSLTFLAFVLRLLVVLFWIDTSGDGPSRAMIAHEWARSPYIPTHGWLPAFTILAGIFSLLVPDPWISTRIFNLLVGTATIPVFYLLVHRLYGVTVAVFSALLLALFPLHISLSATSLSDVSALFGIVAGTALLIQATDAPRQRPLMLGLSLVCFLLGIMTRFELWILVPIFPLYYYLRTRSVRTSLLILLVLALPVAAWIVGEYATAKNTDLLHVASLRVSESWSSPALKPADIVRGTKILGRKVVDHFEWPVALALGWGLLRQTATALAGRVGLESGLHLVLALSPWPLMLYVAMTRGFSVWDRYLLFAFVMILPLAVLPFKTALDRRRSLLAGVTLAAVASIAVANIPWFKLSETGYDSLLLITRKIPITMKQLAAWLQTSPYRDRTIVMTPLGGEATYLFLDFPEAQRRQIIFYPVSTDEEIRRFLRQRRPSLVITREEGEDRAVQAHIKHLLFGLARFGPLVHTQGSIKVYLLDPI